VQKVEPKALANWQIILWILCLAFLSVGARNFEAGLSQDGPLYASIARQIARSSEWFFLDGRVPDFSPFIEHPHLGFWVQSLIFKALPAADWSARISGHLYYVGFLILFFYMLRKFYTQRIAVIGILVLWLFPAFSNYFSNFYLDPGALFWGSLFLAMLYMALENRSLLLSLFSGACLAFAFMSKGLTALAFGPVAAAICLEHIRNPRGRFPFKYKASLIAASLVGTAVVLGLYFWKLSHSSVPDFFVLYWQKQMSARFSKSWNLSGVFSGDFWFVLLKHTHFLAPLALVPLLSSREKKSVWLPSVFFVSFVLIYAPAARIGAQYLVMLLPPIAWLLALTAETLLPKKWTPSKLVFASQSLAIGAVLLLQYGAIRTHSRMPPPEAEAIKKYFADKNDTSKVLLLEFYHNFEKPGFMNASPISWYGDVRVEYSEKDSTAPLKLIRYPSRAQKNRALAKAKTWCALQSFDASVLFERCR
jgi:4-amino-4-deoxy-L-arabinose transferase-like glycosyltransferase